MAGEACGFDWQRGVWRDPACGVPDTRICVAGDWAPIRRFQPLIEHAPEAVYGDLLPRLRAADLAIVNLEAPLSDRGAPVWKSGAVFKGASRHVAGLTAVPFHAVTLANNHLFDFMTRILEGRLNDAPPWAVARVRDYLTRELDEPERSA